jgi:hypothetical protein
VTQFGGFLLNQDPRTNYIITGGFIDTINYTITLLCRTATESPRQQRLPCRWGALHQPLRSAPSAAVWRAAPPSPVPTLCAAGASPRRPAAAVYLPSPRRSSHPFRHRVWAGVRRCERRQSPASPDVHPFRRRSSLLGACGGWGMGLVGIETGPGHTCSKKSAAGGSAASTNSPGRTRKAPYTSSAEDMVLSSLGVVLMPSSTQGRCAGHSWLANLIFRPSLSWR